MNIGVSRLIVFARRTLLAKIRGGGFLLFRFKECWIVMDQLFPVGRRLRAYLDHEYQKCQAQQFANVDHEGVFVLGAMPLKGQSL
jgi:hypothetical protein